jgi:signal transduction histidine kinase
MTEQLKSAIEAAKTCKYVFSKFVSANDAGDTGAHQGGLYIPKNSIKLMFDQPGEKGKNIEKFVRLKWYGGAEVECRFIYYGQGTRNEYRITRLGRHFNIDDFVVIAQKNEDEYLGFLFTEAIEIKSFLDELNITKDDTNSLIPVLDNDREIEVKFKPRARLLLQLGDQLIKNESIALIELVKNSYDADANKVEILMENVDDQENGIIIIEDDGYGMDTDTVENVWMEPGSDFKTEKFLKRELSPKYNRLPIGEKGIGRFGVHKLGSQIEMTTKKANTKEVYVKIDWQLFNEFRYLEQVPVKIIERKNPRVFKNGKTGTSIIISNLRQEWTRGVARNVKRTINSLVSPFESNDSFKASFDIADKPGWFEGLLQWQDVAHYSLFYYKVHIKEGKIDKFLYQFTPWPTMQKLEPRLVNEANELINQFTTILDEEGKVTDFSNYAIGEIIFEGYIFDRESFLMRLGVADKTGFKKYLDNNSGIRVFRDKLRVYDYGEPENDWLDLNIRRVNQPTKRISKNIILGAIYLNRQDSTDLIEKTNREGFVENNAYRAFKSSILHTLGLVEVLRYSDKQKIRANYGPTAKSEPVLNILGELKEYVEKNVEGPPKQEIVKQLIKIEADYQRINDNLLKAAGAGLSMSVVVHEVEKIIIEVEKVLTAENASDRALKLVKHLSNLIDGYSEIIRKSSKTKEDLIKVIDQSLLNTEFRLRSHGVEIIKAYKDYKGDPKAEISRSLLIGSFMNIIDNSIYWLEKGGKSDKKIYIALSDDEDSFLSIVVADNGPGFLLPTDEIVEPFVSAKPDGIGLGLHIASEIMLAQKGKLSFPDWGDYEMPNDFKNGAIVAFNIKK